MFNESIEITVTMKQRQLVLDAISSDYRVNGFSYGYSAFAERTKVLGSLYRDFLPQHFNHYQRSQ